MPQPYRPESSQVPYPEALAGYLRGDAPEEKRRHYAALLRRLDGVLRRSARDSEAYDLARRAIDLLAREGPTCPELAGLLLRLYPSVACPVCGRVIVQEIPQRQHCCDAHRRRAARGRSGER